jgi:hypothetical protein
LMVIYKYVMKISYGFPLNFFFSNSLLKTTIT